MTFVPSDGQHDAVISNVTQSDSFSIQQTKRGSITFTGTNSDKKRNLDANAKTNTRTLTPVVHHARVKHQPADALLRLKTTGNDTTPIVDKILVTCLSAHILPKREVRALYMQEHKVLNHREGSDLPRVHAMETSTDTEYEKCQKLDRSSYRTAKGFLFSASVTYNRTTWLDV